MKKQEINRAALIEGSHRRESEWKKFSFSNGQRTGLLGIHIFTYYLLLPILTVTCMLLGAVTGESISLASLHAVR